MVILLLRQELEQTSVCNPRCQDVVVYPESVVIIASAFVSLGLSFSYYRLHPYPSCFVAPMLLRKVCGGSDFSRR